MLEELTRLYLSSKELLICATSDGLVESRNRLGRVFMDLAERTRSGDHKGIRFVTSINRREDTDMAETLLGLGFHVRHASNFPSVSFSIARDETGDTVVIGLWHNLVVSSAPRYVSHFRSIFEDAWAGGVDGRRRIEEVRSGVAATSVETIGNAEESMKRVTDLIAGEAAEVLMMLPTSRALRRYARAGLFRTIDEAVRKKRKVVVRLLIPSDAGTSPLLEGAMGDAEVEFKRVDESLETGFTMLVIDRRHSFIIELKDDSREELNDSLGMTTYTESRSIATSYAAIFATLWKQAEIFEKLQAHQKMQDEFVNIAAHELRSPVQVIVNSVELAKEEGEMGEFGETAVRSAMRLQRITQDLLDVQRIERDMLQLRKERFALDDLLANMVKEHELGLQDGKVKMRYEPMAGGEKVVVEADMERTARVVSNLLTNAIEFTEEGTITVRVMRERAGGPRLATVEIRDTGRGIDPTILPVLFSKFASKSKAGTGLGLYIAKGIVDAHGGKIWGRNNPDGTGSTFGFSLPL